MIGDRFDVPLIYDLCSQSEVCAIRLHFDFSLFLNYFVYFRLTMEMDLRVVGIFVAKPKKITFLAVGNSTVR